MFSFRHAKCEMPSRYPNGYVEYVLCLEFRGAVWVGNTNLGMGRKAGFSLSLKHKILYIRSGR